MRTIKFRAWDKKEKKIFNVMQLGFKFDVDNYNHTAWADLDGRWGRAWLNEHGEKRGNSWSGQKREAEDIELMQFTGLTDKNGKEIYEGDIVETPKGIKYGVFWSPTKTKFALKTANVWTIYLAGAQRQWIYRAMESATKFEVIGNIYENPELLNQKEI